MKFCENAAGIKYLLEILSKLSFDYPYRKYVEERQNWLAVDIQIMPTSFKLQLFFPNK